MGDQRAILNHALRDAEVTREVVLERSAIASLPGLVRLHAGLAPVLVVADETTHRVAGAQALEHLAGAGVRCVAPLVLPAVPRLKPQVEFAAQIASRLGAAGAVPLAVGSGVINDLVKYAAALATTPYICLATAASMDGYAASGAALIDAGFKRTLACSAPVAILADIDVLAAAPVTMTGWGYGDLAGKVVAGADWMLADALGAEPINPGPFSLVQDNLAAWLAHPQALAAGDPLAFERLLCGLLVSGLAMQAHGNSRPASGSDHQFAHLWEMEGLSVAGEPAAHGACVGVGCVAMLALYEWLATQPVEARSVAALDIDPAAASAQEREIAAAFSTTAMVESARVEMAAKRDAGDWRCRLQRLAEAWPSLRAQFADRLPRAHEMQAQLRALGAPAHPADLGLELETFAADHRRARLIRRRYTVLDLVDDLGWLDRALLALFGGNGFWGRQADYRGCLSDRPCPHEVH
jgi:glycerol-1-phosphate dehydrogenase [NAD(P)+]